MFLGKVVNLGSEGFVELERCYSDRFVGFLEN